MLIAFILIGKIGLLVHLCLSPLHRDGSLATCMPIAIMDFVAIYQEDSPGRHHNGS